MKGFDIMINRKILKADAKNHLKRFYFKAVIVFVINMLLSWAITRVLPSFDYQKLAQYPEQVMEIISENIGTYMSMYYKTTAATLIINIFIFSPLMVGIRRFFMEATDERTDILNIFYAFKNDYLNIVKVMFLKNLFVFLWSLLFVIPGVIKSYQLYFTEFILAENPGISYREAAEKSRSMTDGYKFNIFVMQLSFIPWLMLGAVALVCGVVFVYPYIYESFELLYRYRKNPYHEL